MILKQSFMGYPVGTHFDHHDGWLWYRGKEAMKDTVLQDCPKLFDRGFGIPPGFESIFGKM